MSAGQSRDLRFRFSVDDASAQKVKTIIQEITAEATKLVEAFNRGGGFGGFFSGASNRVGGVGTATGPGAAGMGAGGGGNIGVGMANSLTKVLVDNKNLLKGIASESKDVMKVMQDALRDSFSKQAGEVAKLRSEIKLLSKDYKDLGNAQGAMLDAQGNMVPGGYAGARSKLQEEMAAKMVTLGKAEKNLDALEAQMTAQGSGGGRFAALKKGFGQIAGGLGQILNPMGIPGFGGMSAGAAIIGGYSYLTNQYLRRDSVEANEALNAPLDALSRRARVNQAYGNIGMGIRRDISQAAGFGTMSMTDLRAALGPEAFNAMVTQAYQKTGNTPSLSDIGSNIGDWVMRGGGDQSARGMALERALGNINADQAERLADVFSKRMASMSVRDRTYISEYQGEVFSRMALQRAARMGENIGGGMNYRRDPVDPRKIDFETYDVDRAQLMSQGTNFTNEEIGGMRQRLAQVAGGRYMGFANQALVLQAGGLNNAAELYGQAAQFGGGGNFMGALSRASSLSGGRGLVDVAASGQIGDMVMRSISGAGFGVGGTPALEGIMSVAGMMGGGLRSASDIGGGMSALDALRAGKTDRLQEAINVLSANRAAPGADLYGRDALRGMNTAQMLSVLRGGDLPTELSDRGIGRDQVAAYARNQARYFLARYNPGAGTGTAVGTAVAGFRGAGGDLGKYLRGLGANGKTKAGRSILFRQLQLLGEAMHDTRMAGSDRAGMGMLGMSLAGTDEDMFSALSGGGIFDPAAGGSAAKTKQEMDKAKLDKEHRTGQLMPTIQAGAGQAAVDAADAMEKFATGITGPSGMIKALGNLTQAINDAARQIASKQRVNLQSDMH